MICGVNFTNNGFFFPGIFTWFPRTGGRHCCCYFRNVSGPQQRRSAVTARIAFQSGQFSNDSTFPTQVPFINNMFNNNNHEQIWSTICYVWGQESFIGIQPKTFILKCRNPEIKFEIYKVNCHKYWSCNEDFLFALSCFWLRKGLVTKVWTQSDSW